MSGYDADDEQKLEQTDRSKPNCENAHPLDSGVRLWREGGGR